MRILVLSDLWLPFPGGAERMIANITDALVTRGHEIHILTSYAKAKSKYPLTIREMPTHDDVRHVLHDALQDSDADIILTHHHFVKELWKELLGPVFNKRLGHPFVEIVHSRQRHPSASFAIFNSQYTANRCGRKEEDMVMLPPADERCMADGLESPTGSLPQDREYIGHIKPIPNTYQSLYGNRIPVFGKGIHLTYSLAATMPERKFLVLRGEWQNCEVIQEMPNVEFMEPVDDIRDFYARCRLVVMPSGHEDAGTVPQECALNCIPCISSDVGGLSETNRGGIRLPYNDLAAWQKAIRDLDDPAYYNEIVRSQLAALPDWEKSFNEIDAKMRALCARP